MPTSGQVYHTSKTSSRAITDKSGMRAKKSEAQGKAQEKVIKGSNSHTTSGVVGNRISAGAQLTRLSMD